MSAPHDPDSWFDEQLGGTGVMVILRGFDPARTLELARTAWAAGIRAVEVPVQGEESLRSLTAVARAAPDGAPVGAGTIVSPDQVALVRDAGAVFTVSPGFDREVSVVSRNAGLPHLPGVATATEVHHAVSAGHRWLKLFPATVLGAELIPALHGPFPMAKFCVTGGISVDNAARFLDAGASAVSLGSSFAGADASDLAALVGRIAG
ncbi:MULTISPECIES: bifunctional 4-hydroxy-2-oxoglutarate aldolase/2-dehydro-3-deoxy-phosphogluconate aldolase [unclassified Knoellia]|uniref:bifunctional 4-hydroxy-2-oxoglutarate aldolase/2-dehydro-3-deoxy-phosphogluconate aldolase n=1 Tax=Knoellia altitudinis TaxID=3404795 RepID=UPI003612B9B9